MLCGFNLNWVCFTSGKDSKEFLKFVTSFELGFVSFVGFTAHNNQIDLWMLIISDGLCEF